MSDGTKRRSLADRLRRRNVPADPMADPDPVREILVDLIGDSRRVASWNPQGAAERILAAMADRAEVRLRKVGGDE